MSTPLEGERFEAAFRALQATYVAELPARLAELEDAAERWRAGTAAAREALRLMLHRLAGSGGSYEFPEISRLARAAEAALERATPAASASLDAALAEIGREIARLGAG